MKPTTRASIERRLEVLEERRGVAPEEPLVIRVQYVGPDGKEHFPATEWTRSYGRTDENGRELIVEWPVYNGPAPT